MKKLVLSGVLSMFTAGLLVAQTGEEKLPQNSQEFIAQHFSSETITYVEKDNWTPLKDDDMYEVHFSSGLEMSFNKAGEITEIEAARDQNIPSDALPDEILAYVNSNYPDFKIKSWEKDGKEQDVELSNGVDLEFDKNGKFLRVD